MAPYLQQQEAAGAGLAPKAKLQSESAVLDHGPAKKPVADDFMYDFKYNHSLPTTDTLGVEIPTDCDAQKEAAGIVVALSAATSAGDAQAFASIFLDYGKKTLRNQARTSRL
jgi:hypothetical protein